MGSAAPFCSSTTCSDWTPRCRAFRRGSHGSRSWRHTRIWSCTSRTPSAVYLIRSGWRIAFTPDRVQKKAVELDDGELTWATAHEDVVVDMYLTEDGVLTKEDFYARETEHAAPMIEQYASGMFPTDRLYRLDEEGDATDYPLDYPLYG